MMLGAKLVLCCLLAVALAEEAILRTPEQVHEYMEALIKSREDDGLTLEERMALNPNGTVLENSGRYQGDILLSDEQIEDMVAYRSSSRMAYIRPNRRWPNRIVPYQFLQNEFTQAQQRHIISVMDIIMRRTCVRFRLRTSSDRQFMTITGRATGCYAHLGFNPSRTAHNMNVARNTIGQGCLNAIVIAHEFYHILGFSHMHQSPPRDSYIRVLWDNIMDRYRFAFNRDPAQHFDMQRLPYEYGSMMHYGLFSASRNGRPTMQVLRQHTGEVGSLRQISGWDILRLQRHYNCPGAWSDEALNKARFTAYVPNEDDEIVETTVPEQPLADELEPAY